MNDLVGGWRLHDYHLRLDSTSADKELLIPHGDIHSFLLLLVGFLDLLLELFVFLVVFDKEATSGSVGAADQHKAATGAEADHEKDGGDRTEGFLLLLFRHIFPLWKVF